MTADERQAVLRDAAERHRQRVSAYAGLVERFGRRWAVSPDPTGGLRRMAPKACWRNAAVTAWKYGLRYCEGFTDGIEHAWNLDAADRVIDRTWRPAGMEYVGVALTPAELASLVDGGEFGPVLFTWAALLPTSRVTDVSSPTRRRPAKGT